MKVLHGIWTPASPKYFMQSGQFSIWLETDEVKPIKSKTHHPRQLSEKEGLAFLKESYAYIIMPNAPSPQIQSVYLPTLGNTPLPSPELSISDVEGGSCFTSLASH